MITLNIPFQGFYESVHTVIIDDAENQLFTDRATGNCNNEGLLSHFQGTCKYRRVFTEYAKAYANCFSIQFSIPSLKFISLESPRSYNYSTDKIECSIRRADIRRIYKEADKTKLAEFVTEHCTSRSGFSSFYSPDLKSWGYVDAWEYAQLSLLLQFYFENHANFDDYWEYETMQDYECNGYVTQWLENACPIIARLYSVHDYLENRALRGN